MAYTLTEKRMAKVRPILDRGIAYVARCGHCPPFFEKEMREALSTGYREMKDVARALYKMPDTALLAEAYMRSDGPLMCSEFKATLCVRGGERPKPSNLR